MWYNFFRDMHLACSSSSNPFSSQSGKNWRSYGWIFVGWGEKRCWYTLLHRSRHAVLRVCAASNTSKGPQSATDVLVNLCFEPRVQVRWLVAGIILVRAAEVCGSWHLALKLKNKQGQSWHLALRLKNKQSQSWHLALNGKTKQGQTWHLALNGEIGVST